MYTTAHKSMVRQSVPAKWESSLSRDNHSGSQSLSAAEKKWSVRKKQIGLHLCNRCYLTVSPALWIRLHSFFGVQYCDNQHLSRSLGGYPRREPCIWHSFISICAISHFKVWLLTSSKKAFLPSYKSVIAVFASYSVWPCSYCLCSQSVSLSCDRTIPTVLLNCRNNWILTLESYVYVYHLLLHGCAALP